MGREDKLPEDQLGVLEEHWADEVEENKRKMTKYRVVAFLRVVTEPEEDELFDTIEEAEEEKESLQLMQTEDRFEIEKV